MNKMSGPLGGGIFLTHTVCLACYMLSPVRLSVRPSVTRVYHRKTVEVRIMKFSPYGSPIPLVFVGASFIQKF